MGTTQEVVLGGKERGATHTFPSRKATLAVTEETEVAVSGVRVVVAVSGVGQESWFRVSTNFRGGNALPFLRTLGLGSVGSEGFTAARGLAVTGLCVSVSTGFLGLTATGGGAGLTTWGLLLTLFTEGVACGGDWEP